jgi:hypothetical protein
MMKEEGDKRTPAAHVFTIALSPPRPPVRTTSPVAWTLSSIHDKTQKRILVPPGNLAPRIAAIEHAP